MFAARWGHSLASMSEIDAVPLNWSDLGVSELVPTGTVTLLLADVEGSTRLWENQPDEMTAAGLTYHSIGRPSRATSVKKSAGLRAIS